MQPSLVILAAGMGSRYGGLKQIDGVGPHDETIIEHSIFDALKAGFGKIVFVIRRDIEQAFKARFSRIQPEGADFRYVYQELDSYTAGRPVGDRVKPWGTAHAMLAAKEVVNEPFAVINADDYYGTNAYGDIAQFLRDQCRPDRFAMMGYRLANTLSDHGSVSRGVCVVNEEGQLQRIDERTKVQWQDDHIIYMEGEQAHRVDRESAVSMNFWGFHHTLFPRIEERFHQFIDESQGNPKAEFFIPLLVQEMMDASEVVVDVLPCPDKWYGVTYKEDKPMVQSAFQKMCQEGVYPSPLWG